MSDEELMINLNEDNFGLLIDRYQRLVYTIAYRITKDANEAEGLVWHVFMEIWRKAALFNQAKGNFKVWLMRYAYTRSINRREALESRKFYSTVPIENWDSHSLPHYEERLAVTEGLEFLSSRQRQALELIGLQGLTLAEATKVMGFTLAAVRNYYFRGLRKMKEVLS